MPARIDASPEKEDPKVTTIAVPIAAGGFSGHFGGAEAFALYRVDVATGAVSERRMITPPEHGRGVFPAWLRQQGAQVVLAGGMGPRAIEIFARQGMEVVLGVEGTDPDQLVRQFLAGTLATSGEPCREQGLHDCGHPHHDGCGGH